jgi:hypothetical protein
MPYFLFNVPQYINSRHTFDIPSMAPDDIVWQTIQYYVSYSWTNPRCAYSWATSYGLKSNSISSLHHDFILLSMVFTHDVEVYNSTAHLVSMLS